MEQTLQDAFNQGTALLKELGLTPTQQARVMVLGLLLAHEREEAKEQLQGAIRTLKDLLGCKKAAELDAVAVLMFLGLQRHAHRERVENLAVRQQELLDPLLEAKLPGLKEAVRTGQLSPEAALKELMDAIQDTLGTRPPKLIAEFQEYFASLKVEAPEEPKKAPEEPKKAPEEPKKAPKKAPEEPGA